VETLRPNISYMGSTEDPEAKELLDGANRIGF